MGNDKGVGGPPRPGESARPRERARYTKPELVAYGPLAKLTRGVLSGTGENTAQGGMRTMVCL